MDIYNTDSRVEASLRRLNNDGTITKTNKDLILKFHRDIKLEGLNKHTQNLYLMRLTKIAQNLNKPIENMNKDDIKDILTRINDFRYNGKKISEGTKKKYKIAIKRFFKWLRDTEDYPEEVKWIKTADNSSKKTKPEDLVTDKEFENLLKHTENPRDRAMLWILWECGCRIGELLTMKVKDVKFDDYGAIIHVSGKTGYRRIRLVNSVPSLSKHLENHPTESDEEPLWISNNGLQMNHDIFRKFLRELKERAGFSKRLHAHLFRHTAATRLAKSLTEQQLKNYFGWNQKSDMAAVYVSLSGKDMDDAILQMNGKIPPKEESNGKYLPKRCLICKTDNEYNSDWCSHCRHPISEKAKQESLDKEQMMIQTLLPSVQELIRNEVERMRINP